ncbi:DUF6326 family protein [Patescibacteria group bacterium]
MKKLDIKEKLSLLWIFVTLNYLYCDVLGHMDPEVLNLLLTGDLGFVKVTPMFLLMGSVLMELPISMVLLSRILKQKVNRIFNIIAGLIMTLVQVSSLFAGELSPSYMFFSVIEVATTAFIVWFAWKWPHSE